MQERISMRNIIKITDAHAENRKGKKSTTRKLKHDNKSMTFVSPNHLAASPHAFRTLLTSTT